MTQISAPHQFMALDVLTEILARAGSPLEVAGYVTATLRELTGARGVGLYQRGEVVGTGAGRLLDLCPARRAPALPAAGCRVLAETLGRDAASAWLTLETAPAPVRQVLEHAGFSHALVVRLAVAANDVGNLILFDLPEGAERVDDVVQFLEPLATLVALVLRNAFLFEQQEAILAERTRQIRESEERYRQLFHAAPYGVGLAEAGGGRLLDLNEQLAAMVGRTREELLGQPQSVLHPPEAALPGGEVSRTFAQHRSQPGMVVTDQLLTRHGERREVEIKAGYTVLNGVECMLGFFQDLTERNRTLAELQHRDEFISILLASTAEAIYGLDGEGRCTFANAACLRLLGYVSEAELLGRSMHDVIHHSRADGSPYPVAECTIYQSYRRGQPVHVEEDLLWRADGTAFSAECWSYPILKAGHPQGAVVTFFDISDRLATQRERVALEEQLRQAQKMEAIGTLAGGIAHDFNNILSAILGYAELTQGALPPGSEERDYLDNVLTAAQRARDLVRQILMFSRKGQERREPVAIERVVREALSLLRKTIPTTITIVQELPAESLRVLADPTQVHQIVMNLCTNAYHAMGEDGGALTVSLAPCRVDPVLAARCADLREGDYARLAVRDTGSGMGPATLARIFEPFFTTKGRSRGTGMGLAVVHGIVTGCGGAILVKSQLGEGSEFQVFLPLVQAQEASPTAVRKSQVVGGQERILVVDDEPALAKLLVRLLETLGYRATCCSDSREALARFRSDPHGFDLMISDQTMPGLSGAALAKEVLALRSDMPIILCTGHSDTLDEAAARRLGARGFLMKPVSREQLAHSVRRVLDQHGRPSGALEPGTGRDR